MKIRIYDNSVRLRLDRSEVDQAGSGKPVERTTSFADGSLFAYRLAASGDEVAARFVDGCVEVSVPLAQLSAWASDDTAVSITGEGTLANGRLTLLVEKDFECLDPRDGEDQSNRFRNPKAQKA